MSHPLPPVPGMGTLVRGVVGETGGASLARPSFLRKTAPEQMNTSAPGLTNEQRWDGESREMPHHETGGHSASSPKRTLSFPSTWTTSASSPSSRAHPGWFITSSKSNP